MSSDLALLSTLIGSNYPCLELIFMVPKVFKPLKFDCICKAIRHYVSYSPESTWDEQYEIQYIHNNSQIIIFIITLLFT